MMANTGDDLRTEQPLNNENHFLGTAHFGRNRSCKNIKNSLLFFSLQSIAVLNDASSSST
jgi:hypothetical protein